MSNVDRLRFIVELSLGAYAIALVLGYIWVRAMHYPFTIRQRKMWTYYVLFVSAFPALCPLCVAMGLWVLPPKASGVLAISLLFVWGMITVYIVRQMSKPGGRLNMERGKAD
jgi:hypothetical protein